MLRMLSILCLVSFSLVIATAHAAHAQPITVGKAAPALIGTTIDGAFDLTAFRKQHPKSQIIIAFSRASW